MRLSAFQRLSQFLRFRTNKANRISHYGRRKFDPIDPQKTDAEHPRCYSSQDGSASSAWCGLLSFYVQNGINPAADLMPLTIKLWNSALPGNVLAPLRFDVAATSWPRVVSHARPPL